jgi:hypothetical protein
LKESGSRSNVLAMRAIAYFLLFGVIAICPVFTLGSDPDGLCGVVVSENGTPIEGVKIFAWQDTTTSAEGRFNFTNLPSKGSVVYFQKEGFRPKTLVVRPPTSEMKVVLEDDSKTAWLIPVCSAKDSSHKGSWLEFYWPKNAKTRRIKDIDYAEVVISVTKDSRPLQIWYGLHVSPGQTVTKLTLNSASSEERSIHRQSGQIIGHDQRGKTQDGRMWRSADFFGMSASAIYEGVSEEDAAAYDRIIDSVCHH